MRLYINLISIFLVFIIVQTNTHLAKLRSLQMAKPDIHYTVGHNETFEVPIYITGTDSLPPFTGWEFSIWGRVPYLQIEEVVINPYWSNKGFIELDNLSPDSTVYRIAAAGVEPADMDTLAFTLVIKSDTFDVSYTPIDVFQKLDEGDTISYSIGVAIDRTLPVELTEFNQVVSSNHVHAVWSTASELNASHFEIHAQSYEWNRDDGTFDASLSYFMGVVEATNNPDGANYRLEGQLEPGVYRLRMIQYDFDGTEHIYWTNVFDVGLDEIKIHAYPNPANPTTTVSLVLDRQRYVSIRMYNLLGQEVMTIYDDYGQGHIQERVNLENVPSGVYFIQAISDKVVSTTKLTVIK